MVKLENMPRGFVSITQTAPGEYTVVYKVSGTGNYPAMRAFRVTDRDGKVTVRGPSGTWTSFVKQCWLEAKENDNV